MVGTLTWNSSAIWACVSQSESSMNRHSTRERLRRHPA